MSTLTRHHLAFADNLSQALARARELLRAKVDPAMSARQADLTSEMDSTVSSAMSKSTHLIVGVETDH